MEAENILKEFTYAYKNVINREGKRYLTLKKWKENKFEINVKMKQKDALLLTVSKGVIAHKRMTEDSFRLILCHEFGHYFGGTPHTNDEHWASNEGQADYYSTSKCIRRIIPKDRDFKSRVQVATLALGKIYAEMNKEDSSKLSLTEKDKREVMTTLSTHPGAQCRVDTMIAGLNCPISESIEFSDKDEKTGACLDSSVNEAFAKGARPRCWYRPQILGKICQSKAFIPGQKIPLVTIYVKKYKEDGTAELSLQVGMAVPGKNYIKKVNRLEKNTRFETHDNKVIIASDLLSLDQKIFATSLKKSLVPINSKDIKLKQQGSAFAFEMKCRDL